MVIKWIEKWVDARRTAALDKSTTPYAAFEIAGFEKDGKIKVTFNWNSAFIEAIHALGFHAETEEDTVQLFFYTSTMRPMQLSGGDDPVQTDSHSALSSRQNVLMQ